MTINTIVDVLALNQGLFVETQFFLLIVPFAGAIIFNLGGISSMNLGNCKISLFSTVNKGLLFCDWKERARVTSSPSGIPDIEYSLSMDFQCVHFAAP